jgi:hypothetical protein
MNNTFRIFNDSVSTEYGECQFDLCVPRKDSGAIYIFGHASFLRKEFYTWIGRVTNEFGHWACIYSTPAWPKNDPLIWESCIVELVHKFKDVSQFKRVIVGGHSTGANGAMLAAKYVDNIDGMILMEPGYPADDRDGDLDDRIRESAKLLTMPVQFQSSTLSKMVAPEKVRKHFDKVPHENKEFLSIAGGNHVGFLDLGLTYTVGRLIDNKPTISHKKQLIISGSFILRFLGVSNGEN